jgi:hypothetical protein
MRKKALIGLTILALAAMAASVVFADSTPTASQTTTDPQPGYTYYVVYRQTDGSIVAAVGCPPSPAYCTPTLQAGQSVIFITDQPLLVKQLFTDAHNAKLGNWHVDLQKRTLVSTGSSTTGAVAPPTFGSTLIGLAIPLLGSIGVVTSGTLIWRRTRRRA